MNRYFRFRWNETRGDQFDNWGFSTWYNEIGEDFYVLRQLEIFDNGNILKYDENHIGDEFGMLCAQPLEEIFEDTENVEITQDEFESIWNSSKALNE